MAKSKNRFRRQFFLHAAIVAACAAVWTFFVYQPELGIWRLLPQSSPSTYHYARPTQNQDQPGDQYLLIVNNGRRHDVPLPPQPKTPTPQPPESTSTFPLQLPTQYVTPDPAPAAGASGKLSQAAPQDLDLLLKQALHTAEPTPTNPKTP